ncbi:MAG: phosphotransferase [Natronospirillum sp.]|uniref:phosphotransferase n=1 Tax=Natronospirillum sp. TaxID=2812955 RepID=UPI0025DCEDDD|nr:phosphotransferase [Natronospirillum sp.]MCH8551583.1 phosphotransferase [Natronospirillum sp.]
MSVFTPIDREELLPWLLAHGIEDLRDFRGISGGTINTNYWLETTSGDWILTLVEDRPAAAVQPVMSLMQSLYQAGLPVPGVRVDQQGRLVGMLKDRPATLVQALPGDHPEPTQSTAAEVGRFLARLHSQTLDLDPLPLNFGPDWQREQAQYWQDRLALDDAELVRRTIQSTRLVWQRRWPEAWLHADLFPDNVLALDGQFTAVIDWYFASCGPRIWDIAIALNAWCGGAQPDTDPVAAALLHGYESITALSATEVQALPLMRRSAALRFWLSRLESARNSDKNETLEAVTVKPPVEYRNLLLTLEQSH